MNQPSRKEVSFDEAERQALSQARYEGVFAGLTGALVSAILGRQVMKLGRYPTLATGLIAGLSTGYLITQEMKETHMSALRREQLKRLAERSRSESFPTSTAT